ncbi:MAG: iron-sulfur cluster assembly scaffold protein [Peptococcaceae bacterium]|jgi:nitrogen fixation NifU-like protein|nr:iron-sulfur cluster assembly scaffold protein [Peptococcaceae bacterium]MDH7524012.1 iron-sulfur cluster assembly scaffold protein [Peptococcaceae bacterium]
MYNEKILDHFLNPRNLGEMDDPDGVGTMGDPSCGDYIKVFLRVKEDRIVDIKFKIAGCPAAVACGSAMTELANGKTIDEACEITDEDILHYLGGLPETKAHCSNLGAGALQRAILDYIVRSLRDDDNVKIV